MRTFFYGGGAIVVLVVFPLLLAAVAALRFAAGVRVRAVVPLRSTAALPFLSTSEKRARRPVVGCVVERLYLRFAAVVRIQKDFNFAT